jgi:hypothetical protein
MIHICLPPSGLCFSNPSAKLSSDFHANPSANFHSMLSANLRFNISADPSLIGHSNSPAHRSPSAGSLVASLFLEFTRDV